LKWDDGGESEQGTGFLVEYGGLGSPSETDTLLNIENLTGSAFDDTVTGNKFANRLDGGAGNDTLIGDLGADTLIGGLGNDIMDAGRGEDILIGGAGADTLTGGTSSDIFRYLDLSDSTAAGRDLITDLVAVDIIDLSAIDADIGSAGNQGFQLVAAFTGAAAQMVLTYNAGANQTLLALDVNGDGVSDFELLMTGSHLDPTGWAL
jgi:Ca2+-binding RTX toxin-like protein